MKKLFSLALASILVLSCSSDDDSGPPLGSIPDAVAQYDASNFGIYKGVYVGSSGVIVIDIKNTGSLSARLTMDNMTHDFTSNETVTENSAINGLTFTSGSLSFDFNVGANGSNPHVNNINFSGHPNAVIEVLKERSDQMVACYKGTYNGDDAGVFNLIIAGNSIAGLGRSNDGTTFYLDGTKSGNSITGTFDGGEFSGTKSGNSLSGNWSNIFNESGSFSGQRKL